jgi:hypothetical protein
MTEPKHDPSDPEKREQMAYKEGNRVQRFYTEESLRRTSGAGGERLATPNPYGHGCLVALAVVWLWNNEVRFPRGSGAAEAIGFDLASIGLPILLLWFSGVRLKAAIVHRGVVAPNKWIIGGICAVWGALGLIDFIQPTTVHRIGAFLTWGLFWSVALILFVAAKVQQSRNRRALI